MARYMIADIRIDLLLPDSLIHPNWALFRSADCSLPADLRICSHPTHLQIPTAISPIVSSAYATIYHPNNTFILCYNMFSIPIQMEYQSDLHHAELYLQDDHVNMDIEELTNALFYVCRDCFSILAQERDLLLIHSSSVLYREDAYLFSAPSGVGKTTHTDLWKKLFDARILNGDVAACRIEDGLAVMYGVPWCGTSGCYCNTRVVIRGIIFLSQATENRVRNLSLYESIINIQARCFSPNWTRTQCEANLAVVKAFASYVHCHQLACLPDEAAAVMMKNHLDNLDNLVKYISE